jgi:hypothetical protein
VSCQSWVCSIDATESMAVNWYFDSAATVDGSSFAM